MNQRLTQLISAYRATAAREALPVEGETISVNDLVRRAASVYEVIRNTLEYSEAHLLRRNAIRRILRRRLSDDLMPERIAKELLQELIWARYLENKRIPIVRELETAGVLKKYVPLFEAAETSPESKRLSSWLLDLLSTELEYLLVPPRREEALVSFAYGTLKTHVDWSEKLELSAEEKDLQLFIGVHRTLLKSNQATLRFRIFYLFYPTWSKGEGALVKEIAEHLSVVHQAVERELFHPMGEPVARMLRRKMVLFKVLHDVITKDAEAFGELASNPSALEEAVKKAAKSRYGIFRARLMRLVLRAVVFLFFTKLVLAFIIELPYEVFVLKESNYVPLLVNIVFHPVLLVILGLTGTIPEKKNTELLVEGVAGMISGPSTSLGTDGTKGFDLKVRVKKPWAQGTAGFLFNLLYGLTFLFSYGLIVVFLLALHFNALSILLFLLFLSLVMFLGITIRRSKRELVIVPGKSGIFLAIGDFFTLPVIRAGRWISMRAPRINIFLFFLDFIVEAPFKMAIQIIEGWLAFMKEKKEEIDVER